MINTSSHLPDTSTVKPILKEISPKRSLGSGPIHLETLHL